MRTKGSSWKYVFLVTAAAVTLLGARLYADTAADIIGFYGPGVGAIYNDDSGAFPVVTAIGSMPYTDPGSGHVYTGWSVFAQDLTGSLDLFISAATLAGLPGSPSTINVGDAVSVAGQASPFQCIPELAFVTTPASNNYFHTVSTGNPLPAPPVFTISQINTTPQITNITANAGIAGMILEVDNVTLTATNGLTALPGYTNNVNAETFIMNDNTGSVTFFHWTTSYSQVLPLAGTPVGTGQQYDVVGFTHAFGSTAEFTALSITPVPEPSTIVLVGVGLVGMIGLIRRHRG